MDASQIRRLGPKLKRFLRRFDDCFSRRNTRQHLLMYVRGQLSDLPRKSVEPIALRSGVAVRTLQEFLSQHKWDHSRMVDRLQQLVATQHSDGETIGIIDETSCVKKGPKTPGVQRQHCGAVGKHENCIVTVHLGYAVGDFHCLLDGELFLPQSWSEDRRRCQEAGVPDEMVYRPKSEIAIELYDRALANGVRFDWLTFDEWYGVKPQFLHDLEERKQKYIGEIHKHFYAWLKPPRVTDRPYKRKGRAQKTPRLAAGNSSPKHVETLLDRMNQPWQKWRVKDGEKGPIVWEVKHAMVHLKDSQGLPTQAHHLLICRNVTDTNEVKYFLSNAPKDTAVSTLLRVAFSRWRIERCFEDQKGEVGLDHFEGRRYAGLKRHLAITAVTYYFLSEARQSLSEKKSRPDCLPGSYGHTGPTSGNHPEPRRLTTTHRAGRHPDSVDPTTQRTS